MNMMRKAVIGTAIAAAAAVAIPAAAQDRFQRTNPRNASNQSAAVNYLQNVPASEQPDVVLDIPNLSVDEITLEVDNLDAKISLDARLANLLRLSAGADVQIDKVSLSIKGVQAEAALIVRLDNVRAIIERTLQTLDNNPQILEQLTGTVDNAVSTTGSVVNNTVGSVSNLTQGVLKSGAILDVARSGLQVVNETTNRAGNTVRRLTDGQKTYEVVTDTAGKILRSTQVGS